MSGQEPEEGIGGRFRLTAAQAVPPPLEPLAAVDSRTGKRCEVWRVLPGLAGLDYGALERAAAELKGLRHPSLQDLLGVFPEPGGPGEYWVYEAAPGKHFEALAGEGRPFTEAEAADMAASLAGALKKLHGAGPGFSHDRISPRNIYLAEDGRAVLGGIKPFPRRPGGDLYYPPGEAFSRAADVYALGASLLFLLTGKKPEPGAAAGAFGDLDKSLPFSPGFIRALKKMTAADPSERYRSAAELGAALAALLTGKPVPKHKILLRAAALCALLAAAGWGLRGFILERGKGETLFAGRAGWAEPGGLEFSRDGKLLVLAGDSRLYIWDTKDWREEITNGFANGPGKYTRYAEFLPDGGVVAASSSGEGASELRFVSALRGNRSVLLNIPLEKKLDSASLSPDGTLVAVAVNTYDRVEERHLGGEITVFNTAGRVVHKPALAGGPAFSVKFTPDGGSLVYKTYLWDKAAKAHNLGRIVRRDLASGSESVLLRDKPGPGSGLFSYSPSGLLVTPVGNTEVLSVSDPSGRRLAELNSDAGLEEYRYPISAEGAFSRDGALFAAQFTSRDRVSIRLFETASWKLVKTFRLGWISGGAVAGIAFDPGGKFLAAAQGKASGSKVYVYKLKGVR
ncbi:MAG: hypothetical protein HY550_05550 [Elusimicrobia bacterium]|nr:hypothetical protein [Elusimicrobiota bacterium]